MRWLSSDPIQIGDVSLPLRPVVGLLVLVLGLVGINAAQKDDPHTPKPGLAEATSVAIPAYPSLRGQYRSAPNELGGAHAEGRRLGRRGAGPALAAYQGFRFRDVDVTSDWMPAYRADREGYRFRPLNDRERERMHAVAVERRFVPEAAVPSLYDEFSGSYGGGFDWKSAPAKPEYSRTW